MLSDVKKAAEFLENSVRDFTDMAIVGVSGGVDSSVVASICVSALGPENVLLISMPYGEIDRETFNSRSARLAEQLQARHHTVPIREACEPIEQNLKDIFAGQDLDILTPANIRPRVRMNILYSISGELGYKTGKRVRVMGTGHLSEDIIGYDTKGGDALCDIFILSDLLKSEVYQLAGHYNVPEEICEAAPSAGLYPDQTDEDELGYSYSELEPASLALFKHLKSGATVDTINVSDKVFSGIPDELISFVVSRYKAHYHKHEAPATVDFPRGRLCE